MFSSMVLSSAVVEASATVPPPPSKPPDLNTPASLLPEPPVPPIPPEPPPLVSSHSLLALESPLTTGRLMNRFVIVSSISTPLFTFSSPDRFRLCANFSISAVCSLFSVLYRRDGSTVLRQKLRISPWLCSSNSTVLYESGLHFSKVGDDTTNTNLGFSVSDLAGWMRMFSSQFTGSSSRCSVISVAKFLAASFALVAEACSGNVSPSVISHSQDFISLSNLDGFNSICFNVMFVSIFYDFVFCFTFVITVFSASLAIVFGILNNCSMFGD